MALSIGELVGYVDLDTKGVESGIGKVSGLLGGAGGKWGKVLGGIGAAGAVAFGASLAGAMDIEPARDRVAAALDLTTAQADRAGKVAGKVYADGWGESADDVAGAVEAVMSSIKGMRNASEKDLRATTTAALTFSEAMGVDVGRAAQVAGQMVRNGLAKNATQAFDLLTKASSRVPIELRQDVLDATDEYGQFFNTLGIKGPQAMGMLAKGAQQGMYGIDKAGDAVKEFTIRSTDMSATSQQAYKAIGLDAHKMANDILAGGNTARKATNKIIGGLLSIKDPAKRANASIALFGTPLEDLNTKDIPTFLRSLQAGSKGLGKWQGATKRAGDTLHDNASNNLTRFKREVTGAFVSTLGGKVLPLVTKWSGTMADDLGPALGLVSSMLSKVTKWLGKHSTVTKVLVGLLAGLVAVTLAHNAAMAVSAAGGMASWLKGTRLVSSATKVWTAVQWALNAAMSANPITLVVIAVAALVAGLVLAYKKSETFRNIVNGAFSAVKKVAGKVLDWLTKAVGKAIDFVRKHWRLIVGILGGPLAAAVLLVTKHWDKIKALTSKAIDKVVGFVKSIPGRFKSGLSRLGGIVGDLFHGAMQRGKDAVTGIGSTIVSWITGIPGRLRNLAGRFGDAGRALLQRFIDGMKNAAGIISGIAGNVWSTVRGMLNGAIDRINAALNFTIKLPGPDLHVDVGHIPHLATGGRATRDTLAVIGDGREPESVLPDSMLRGLLERAHNAGRDSAGDRGNGRNAPLIGAVYQSAGESADVLAERLWFKTRTRG